MVIRLGVMILVAALACCSTQAQSLLMDDGEWGLYVQGAIANGIGVHVSGGEIDLGIAPSDHFDLGVSYLTANNNSDHVGPWFNAYPLKIEGQRTAFLIGIHAALSFRTTQFGSNMSTVGATTNLILHTSAKTGVLLGGGISANSQDGRQGLSYSGMIGLSPFFKTKGGHPISVMFQYGVNEEFNTLGVGLSLGFVKERATS